MDINSILELSSRLLVAIALGGIIGIEREFRAKDAGFRTHFLVSLGSVLFCIVSQYGFGVDLKDSSRVAAQVVSGIGFLGAGTIIFHKNMVHGLTTAAGLWVTAAIGLACGTGMFMAATISTVFIILGLEVLHAFIPQIGTYTIVLTFSSTSKERIKEIVDQIKRDSVELFSYELKLRRNAQGEYYNAHIEIKVKRDNYNEVLMNRMSDFDDVTITRIE